MLCTLAEPTSGTARVSGFDVVTVARRRAPPDRPGLPGPDAGPPLTAEQYLRLHAELYGIEPRVIPAGMDELLDMVGLADRRDQAVLVFFGGMKRRLEIACGPSDSPRVLFLDELTIGLDPQTRSSIWR